MRLNKDNKSSNSNNSEKVNSDGKSDSSENLGRGKGRRGKGNRGKNSKGRGRGQGKGRLNKERNTEARQVSEESEKSEVTGRTLGLKMRETAQQKRKSAASKGDVDSNEDSS